MTDPRTRSVMAAITARYPGTRIEVVPNRDPATAAAIPDFMFVLDVPEDLTHEVTYFGLDVAFAVFGDDPLPFHLGAIDPVQTALHHRSEAVGGQVSEA